MKEITGYTKVLGIIANPIRHSLSPKMHNTACQKLGLDYVYVAFEVEEEQFVDAFKGLKAMKIEGLNVSMPYKQTIIPYLDSLTLRAKLCGAVNTVVYQDNKYVGDITDGPGFMNSLYDKGWNPINKKMTLLGAGGAAFAIMVQAVLDDVKEVVVYKRKNASYEETKQKIDSINKEAKGNIILKPLEDLDSLKKDIHESYILVNATNVGMGNLAGKSCIPDSSYFTKDLKVADIIYNPEETELLKQAKAAGLDCINGKSMILFQGALSFEQWTKQKMPIGYMKEILEID
ncbi:MAG: shikimate dehydrogenase [Coprobacillaceae bacterium]